MKSYLHVILISLFCYVISGCGFNVNSTSTQARLLSIKIEKSKQISEQFEHKLVMRLHSKNISVSSIMPSHTVLLTGTHYLKQKVGTSLNNASHRYKLRYSIIGDITHQDNNHPINIYSERVFDDNSITPNSKNREYLLIKEELRNEALERLANTISQLKIR
jgi:outer membrane lipopolysaccharide assembly protein LptE/RlpB